MHAIAATLVLGLLPATAHGWLDANGTDFVVKPWSQLQTLAVRRRKRGWIAIQRPAACEPGRRALACSHIGRLLRTSPWSSA